MEFRHHEVDYRTLTSAVIPRPIAWVSSTSPDGVDNLAPFSFFNIASVFPPVLFFAPLKFDHRKPDHFKDTPRNIHESREFVVNVVTSDVLEAMNETSARLPTGESEFDHADLTRAESTVVSPPRVEEAAISFECTLYDEVPIGRSMCIFGEVVHAHVDDGLLTEDGKMDVMKVDAVGRLAGSWYTLLDDENYRSIERPE